MQAAPRVELGATTTASTTIVDTSKTPVNIPTVTLAASVTTVDETAPNNVVTYTATLSSPATSALSIPYTLGGTAVAADYSTTSTGTINIGVGATSGSLVLTTVADTTTEGLETVSVTLGTATGVILSSVTTQSTTIIDSSVGMLNSSLDGLGTAGTAAAPLNLAATGSFNYTDNVAIANNVTIAGFGTDDQITITGATAAFYNSAISVNGAGDVLISYNSAGQLNTITLTGVAVGGFINDVASFNALPVGNIFFT